MHVYIHARVINLLGPLVGTEKMVWSKLRSHFKCTGMYEKDREDCSGDVNEEYMAAHRTKSYIEMSDKVETRVMRKSLNRLTSSASLSHNTPLSEYIIEPRQETIASMIEASNLHPLIIAYFQDSFEACNTCELLLHSVHQVRNNYKTIQAVIKLSNGISDHRSYTNAQFQGILDKLASYMILRNLLMTIKPAQFRDIHNNHGYLLCRLTTKFKNIQRKATSMKYSPASIASSFGLVKRNKLKNRELEMGLNDSLGAELEVAAKGVFIMINEFDTMSRLVKRLQDEIEHNKAIADMCVKNGKGEMLIEVVKEFQQHQMCFLDQLEELEEHIYLCFLTINRSRMLVMQETKVLQKE